MIRNVTFEHTGFLEQISRKTKAVFGKAAAIGVQVESTLWLYRNIESEHPQGR